MPVQSLSSKFKLKFKQLKVSLLNSQLKFKIQVQNLSSTLVFKI